MSVILSNRLPPEPLDALRALASGQVELDRLRRAYVAEARRVGISWAQIGEALGMTRQSAWEYFTRDARAAIEATAQASAEIGEDEALALAVEETRAVRRRRSVDARRRNP